MNGRPTSNNVFNDSGRVVNDIPLINTVREGGATKDSFRYDKTRQKKK